MRLVPKMVSVKAAPPTVTELGLMVEMVGVPNVCWLIMKLRPLEMAPPGLRTVTRALPCEAIRLAGTNAVN